MPVTATCSVESQRLVGDLWPIEVDVTDDDAYTASETPVVTVTKPDGTTAMPTVESTVGGRYRASYPLAAAGRHVATATTTGYGAAAFTVTAVAATPAGSMPAVADVTSYLTTAGMGSSWTPEEIADALAAETEAQRSICVIPAYYPADLRNALMRRCARNLGMRRIPLAQPVGDAEAGGPAFSPYDPEINRFERPHRRLLIA